MRATTQAASHLSGVSARTIQRWASQGRITSTTRGGKLLVNPVEVEQLAARRTAGRLPKTTG